MLIQCTAALQAKIKKYVDILDLAMMQAEDAKVGSAEDFFAWHANIHPFDQQHSCYIDSNKIAGFKAIRNTVVLTNNVSHAPAIIVAARSATFKDFVDEIKKAVRLVLLEYGATDAFIAQYLAEPVLFTKSGTRRQIGLHNGVVKYLQWVAPDWVGECNGNLEMFPSCAIKHVKSYLVGAPDYYELGERTEKALKSMGGLREDADTWEKRIAREKEAFSFVNDENKRENGKVVFLTDFLWGH
ncbi:MAG: hypothetical protein E7202_01080 [Selenomonas ruminantium]|jgi:hypothetical protein|nr:hypothetical protein [Selenomonas ruminantium]